MYFNDVAVGYYVAITFIGLIVGKFVAWCNKRLPEKEKIFSKDFFSENKEGLRFNYVFMILVAVLYDLILYRCGLNKSDFYQNLDLIKYMILIPMLLLTFSIDTRYRIIPNRLTLTMFEFGLIMCFAYGINNVNMAKEYILGMLIGGAIFGVITLLGGIIAGKEAMGLGDVKFMLACGLYFWCNQILEVALLAFFVGAIASIVMLIVRNAILKQKDDYIAFGPFLSLASLACIFIQSGTIMNYFMVFCTYLSNKIF